MATENPRVWFKSISLENVRSFGTKQTIYFTEDGTENGKAARWNVILGDNGTGKTTVLKGLCVGVENNYTEDKYIDSLSRNALLDSNILLNLEERLDEKIRSEKHDLTLRALDKRKLHQVALHTVKVGLIRNYRSEEGGLKPVLFAYGAARRIGESSITKQSIELAASLFDENVSLINAEELLVQAEYFALKEGAFYENKYKVILRTILKLLKDEVFAIYAGVDENKGFPKVIFETHYGPVRLHELSLGYKTLIAWMVDFAKGLLDRYPDSPDPLAEPAVCLVDEIDLHLHPKFQRTIIKFLTETFPNTQFIVTAHSPLIVVAAEERPLDANIILLKREGDQTVVVNNPIDVSRWSVDQILNSDLFGYVPPTSEPLTELRTERDTLLAKPKLTKKDQARLNELDTKIGFIPFGQNQDEIKAETIIQQLANVLRSKQGVQ